MTGSRTPHSAFELLRGLAQRPEAVERCEVCSEKLGLLHEHLLDTRSRKLLCACVACANLFNPAGAARFKRVPRRVISLAELAITDAEWDTLAVPIGLAFFYTNGADGKVSAIYPGPAGPVESLLALDAWHEISARSTAIAGMESDVEAVLVNRPGAEYYLAPIDECYRLVGVIRAHWHGLSGGAEVWREIRSFFAELRRRAQPEAPDA
jgi:Family of unknown function (DUF5947)